MPTPPTHERLVAGLVADARPVRPLWSPHTRLALWLVLQVLTLGVAVEFGLRQDLGDHLRQPHFLFEVGALVAAGAMAAAVALRGAIPGMGSGRLTGTFSMALVSAAIVLVSLEPANTVRSAWGFMASGAQCLLCILGFSAIPWTALLVAVHRAAPARPPGHGGIRRRGGLPLRRRSSADRVFHRRGDPLAGVAHGADRDRGGALGGCRREMARSMASGLIARRDKCGVWRVNDAVDAIHDLGATHGFGPVVAEPD